MGGFSVWEKVVSEPGSPNTTIDRECTIQDNQPNSNKGSPTASQRYLKTTEDEKEIYRKKVIKIKGDERSDTATNETAKRGSIFSIPSRLDNFDKTGKLNSKFLDKNDHLQI